MKYIDERINDMAKGRYGDFGGQYIPETLMNEIHKLEDAYEFYKNDTQFNDELNTRRENILQARGPEPHRFPQDKQRTGSGAAREEDGQDPYHR